MNCDTNSLLAAARCYRCIPRGFQKSVQIYLLCAVVKKKISPSYPCGAPSNTIQISGAGLAGVNQNYINTGIIAPYNPATVAQVWFGQIPRLSGGFDIALLVSGLWVVYGFALSIPYRSPGPPYSQYPCDWITNAGGGGIDPAPTGQYI